MSARSFISMARWYARGPGRSPALDRSALRSGVDQLGATVHPEMRLHAEIPLVSLLRLMHLGIACLVGIFGRRRRIDDCRIDDRASGDFQSLRRQMPLHFVEQLLAQIVCFEQMAEAAHRRLVGHRLAAESLPSRRRGSMSTKRRIADESYSASSTAGSDRLNHCCKK